MTHSLNVRLRSNFEKGSEGGFYYRQRPGLDAPAVITLIPLPAHGVAVNIALQ
jgi:hypothetical protein